MMSEKSGGQAQLFYQFNLAEAVPADHMLRKIDTALDLSNLRAQLAPFNSHAGRPSIDPELMIGMLPVGYCGAIGDKFRAAGATSIVSTMHPTNAIAHAPLLADALRGEALP